MILGGQGTMKLSKTDFLIYRECSHNAWLKLHRPDVYSTTPLSVFDLSLMKTGNDVDVLARQLFPGGTLIERGDVESTARLIAAKTPVLYQPVFETERFTTACDILVWNVTTSAYDLYEVKSSTTGDDKKAKDGLYSYDLAFQMRVLRDNGVPLGRLFLTHLDSSYVRGESLVVPSLFHHDDFTERVEQISDAVALEMKTAYEHLQSKAELPAPCDCMFKGRSAHCTTFRHTNPDVPIYSIHDISRIGSSKRKLTELIERRIFSLIDVPDDLELTETQNNQVRVAKTNAIEIDRSAIYEFLQTLQYPLAFLDYETYPCAIPRFPGFKPYDHIPFQFSLDVVGGNGEEMVHHEFLWTETSNPDVALLASLKSAMPKTGSVLTWNKTFETMINRRLAERNPASAAFLADINARVVDLMDVFSKQYYVHPDFKGKTKIKNILPVLVPAFSYKTLEIQEGATATVRWNEIVTGQINSETAQEIRNELLKYCGLDTRAMLEIWRVLVRDAN
jgi:hypothetical protein